LNNELRHPSLLVLGCILGLATSIAPIYLSTFSIFLLPIATEFGWTRGDMSKIFAMTALAIAVASPIVGILVKRFGIRRVLIAGIGTFALSVACVSGISDSFSAYVFLTAIVGFTGAATNTFVYISILPQWFTERLGMMLGITMTGIGIGQTGTPPLAQLLISELGWRNAYFCLAALPVLIALPCVLFLLKERVLTPAQESSAVSSSPEATNTFLKSGPFWMLGLSFLIIAAAASGVGLHTVPILIDRGFTAMEAASLAATGGIAVFIGRLGAGVLLDYIGARLVGAIVFLAAIAGPWLVSSIGPTQLVFLVPIVLGLAIGAEGDLMPYAVKKRFGLANYSVIYGWLFALYNVGVLLGPVLMGLYYDTTGSYDGMLMALIITVGVAFPVFWFAIGASGATSRATR